MISNKKVLVESERIIKGTLDELYEVSSGVDRMGVVQPVMGWVEDWINEGLVDEEVKFEIRGLHG